MSDVSPLRRDRGRPTEDPVEEKLVFGYHRVCPACKGKGTVNWNTKGKNEDIECRLCKGRGYERIQPGT